MALDIPIYGDTNSDQLCTNWTSKYGAGNLWVWSCLTIHLHILYGVTNLDLLIINWTQPRNRPATDLPIGLIPIGTVVCASDWRVGKWCSIPAPAHHHIMHFMYYFVLSLLTISRSGLRLLNA